MLPENEVCMMEWGTESRSERIVNERHPNSHASVVVG